MIQNRISKIAFMSACVFALLTSSACQDNASSVLGAQAEASGAIASSTDAQVTVNEAQPASATSAAIVTVVEVQADNSQTHADAENEVWESSAVTPIVLNGDSITATADGVTVDGSIATIASAGTYSISGSLADGQIVVDTKDEAIVRLILNGVDIRNSTGAPIDIVDAEEVAIVLAENTENTVSDGTSYVFADPASDEPNAAIFSKADLTIDGSGSLTVEGNYNDGIASKDGLIIAGGTITVNAADDGIRGKDYLVVEDGNITVIANGDGLKSDNEEDATQGYIAIKGGAIQVTSGGDAIQAQTDVLVADGDITLSAGRGSTGTIDADASAKGIKGVASVTIDGGTFTVDFADDAIHSNGSVTINGGVFNLTTGDDGMHADFTLVVNGGDIRVTESYEGLESAVITLNDGAIRIVSSDDGINVASGNDGSGTNQMPGGRPGGGGGPRLDAFTFTGDTYLYINGGTIVVDAAGDGLDANGAIEMTGGVVIVNGPTQQMNGALDYDAYFKITGGLLVAAGSAGMAQAPDKSSSQVSLLLNFSSPQQAGTVIRVQTSTGDEIFTFAPQKAFQSIAFSSPELEKGTTYEIYAGGSSTGALVDGLYQDGTYAPGTLVSSFTISGIVTRLGNSSR